MGVVITQPERLLLREAVRAYGANLEGSVLNLGAGSYDRYADLLNCTRLINLDVQHSRSVTIVGDAHCLPFRSAVFDGVLCTQVLEHLRNPAKALRETSRVLRTGGTLLLTVPQTNELHEEPDDFWRFTNYGVKLLAGEAGLEVVDIRKVGGFFSALAQQVIRYLVTRFDPYGRPARAWLIRPVAGVVARFGLLLDRLDKGEANRKFAIGWAAVLKKRL